MGCLGLSRPGETETGNPLTELFRQDNLKFLNNDGVQTAPKKGLFLFQNIICRKCPRYREVSGAVIGLGALTAFFYGGMTMKAELNTIDSLTSLVSRTTGIIDVLNAPLQRLDSGIPYSAEALRDALWQASMNMEEIGACVNPTTTHMTCPSASVTSFSDAKGKTGGSAPEPIVSEQLPCRCQTHARAILP